MASMFAIKVHQMNRRVSTQIMTDGTNKTPYGFVVLHYQAEAMTTQCVDCLLESCGQHPISVVIVDNCSPNGSGRRLHDHYASDNRITVLSTPKNLGFAQGNNEGYALLREKHHCEYITVINNDVLIEQEDFIDRVVHIFERTRFGVLGPDIFEPHSKAHRNPYRTRGYSKEEATRLLRNMQRWSRHYAPHHAASITQALLRKVLGFPYRMFRRNKPWEHACTDVVLQGSCFVFSPEYLAKRSIAFCPDTFLYFEEAILYRDCQKLSLTMQYDPQVHVTHLGRVSTSVDLPSNYAKERMKVNRHIPSLQVFINRFDDYEVADR